jgi:aspartate/methionine/tyrosine aminotransferase
VQREDRVDYVKPAAGTTAFLHYDYDISSDDFCKRLLQRDGTFLVPGNCFEMEHWLRIGYAYDPEQLETGLANVSSFLRVLEGEGL